MNDKLDQIIMENNNKLLDAVNGRTNPTLDERIAELQASLKDGENQLGEKS